MTIIRWRPFSFPQYFTQWPSLWEQEEDWPKITVTEGLDVYETDKEIIVKAAVPGVPIDKVNVTFEDGVLRIKARVEETKEEKEKKKVVYRQQKLSAFDYTTTLPRAVEADKITAEINNGVLSVKAPIAPTAKPKKITVKTKSK